MKRSETLSVGAVFQELLSEDPDFHEQLLQVRALQTLPKLLGPMWQHVGEHSIRDGVLSLKVYSPAVKQGILLNKQGLLTQVNEALGIELLRELALY